MDVAVAPPIPAALGVLAVNQIDFNLEVIRDGLESISADTDKQLRINKNFGKHIDDVFDTFPLDCLPYLVTNNVITDKLSRDIELLNKSIGEVVGNMVVRPGLIGD